MGELALSDDLVDLWSDREWRLNNLYWIEDKHGNVIPFTLNAAQKELLDELHYLNLILKARQLGFSTFILVLALDCALFNDHFAAGLVADTLDNAKNLLKRIKFAYEYLPKEIQSAVPLKSDNATEIELGNGSKIEVGVSLRSGTFNFIHVSEYGKICAKFPDKAREIKSGALNTLASKQLGFIESTAEGRGGDFYDKAKAAQQITDAGREPGELDYKFHFFPWFRDPTYQTLEPVTISAELKQYFKSLNEEHGIQLTDQQKWWYAGKIREQGDDMLKEYPSTPEEAFMGAKDGAYFAKAIRALRKRGKIGQFEFESRTPVNTFWDLGVSDSTVIWLHQQIAGKHRFVGYYENSGEGISHYLDWLDKWRTARQARFGEHHGPHDIEHRKQGIRAESIRELARQLGYEFNVVERTMDKLNSIQNVRTKLPECEFDEAECEEGIGHLESYCREWDEKYGVWKPHPRHDEHSHGADAFMTFADGYMSPIANDDFEQDLEWVV